MNQGIQYPRNPRQSLDGEVLIKRPGKPTLKSRVGNISDGGLYLELSEHDLQKGRRVDVIVVRESGTVRDMQRLSGIVIRMDAKGVAFVTYSPGKLKNSIGQNLSKPAAPLDQSETS